MDTELVSEDNQSIFNDFKLDGDSELIYKHAAVVSNVANDGKSLEREEE